MNSNNFSELVKTSSNGKIEEEILLTWLNYARTLEEIKDALNKENISMAKIKVSHLASGLGDEYAYIVKMHSSVVLPTNDHNPFHEVHLELMKDF